MELVESESKAPLPLSTIWIKPDATFETRDTLLKIVLRNELTPFCPPLRSIFGCTKIASRSVGHGASGTGIVEDGLPWQGKSVEDRLDKLSKRARDAKQLFAEGRDEEYQGETVAIYNRLRTTWERALESIAFGGVVQRHRDYIDTKHLRKAVVLTDLDCVAFHAGFKKCCDVTDAHDPSAGRNAQPPLPSEILKDIQDCVNWTASLRFRQKQIP